MVLTEKAAPASLGSPAVDVSLPVVSGRSARDAAPRMPCAPAATDNNALLQQVVYQTEDAVLITDVAGTIIFVNPAFERDTEYLAEEVIGTTPAILKSGIHPDDFYAALWATLRNGEVFRGVFVNRKKCGERYSEEKVITPIRDAEGAVTHYVSTGRDIGARFAAQARVEFLANHDPLTELPNRTLFYDRFQHAITRSLRDGCLPSLLYIDLDRFKPISDSLGRGGGDALLVRVAERLRSLTRSEDTIARLGGDEFAIALEGVRSPADSARIAQSLITAFQQPFEHCGRPIYIGLSIGIACYPVDGEDVEALIKHADIAMLQAKSRGRSCWVNYSAVMDSNLLDDLSMDASLRSALSRQEFDLHFQPIVDPADRSVVALEALLRWHSPSHGMVPPSRFIPMLECNALIIEVGRWTLERACERSMLVGDLIARGTILAVNLSGRQFRDGSLVDDVRRILQRTGFPPAQLELEITESILIEDSVAALATLNALKTLGVRLAIDDFGTGYSSLSYLRRFPLDTLKIDRSFVVEMESSHDAAVVVRTIVSLAHNLGLDVVGEGVETAGQMALLSEMGCRKVQGYWFSPPCTISELCAFSGQTAVADQRGAEGGVR
ncbi:MAG: EAL domain-containing protein [Rhodocyclaceae bacterium]|nr:EAL domain-containing protein [Rhodocyclaceae bacterium]